MLGAFLVATDEKPSIHKDAQEKYLWQRARRRGPREVWESNQHSITVPVTAAATP